MPILTLQDKTHRGGTKQAQPFQPLNKRSQQDRGHIVRSRSHLQNAQEGRVQELQSLQDTETQEDKFQPGPAETDREEFDYLRLKYNKIQPRSCPAAWQDLKNCRNALPDMGGSQRRTHQRFPGRRSL